MDKMAINIPRTFVLTVRRPIKRFDDTVAHLDSLGIKWERFDGIDNQITRLQAIDTFDHDRTGDRIGSKHVAATLTHYLCWKVLSYLPEDSFWVLEFDVRLSLDWKEQYERAMSVLPDDWQILFLGSCCCTGRETRHVAENVYEVKWPLCGHALQIRQSALPILLEEHQRISMPLDIAMFNGSLRKLRVYTILPSLITQHNTLFPA